MAPSINSGTVLQYKDSNQHKSQGLAQTVYVEGRQNKTDDTEHEIAYTSSSHVETTTSWKVLK